MSRLTTTEKWNDTITTASSSCTLSQIYGFVELSCFVPSPTLAIAIRGDFFPLYPLSEVISCNKLGKQGKQWNKFDICGKQYFCLASSFCIRASIQNVMAYPIFSWLDSTRAYKVTTKVHRSYGKGRSAISLVFRFFAGYCNFPWLSDSFTEVFLPRFPDFFQFSGFLPVFHNVFHDFLDFFVFSSFLLVFLEFFIYFVFCQPIAWMFLVKNSLRNLWKYKLNEPITKLRWISTGNYFWQM